MLRIVFVCRIRYKNLYFNLFRVVWLVTGRMYTIYKCIRNTNILASYHTSCKIYSDSGSVRTSWNGVMWDLEDTINKFDAARNKQCLKNTLRKPLVLGGQSNTHTTKTKIYTQARQIRTHGNFNILNKVNSKWRYKILAWFTKPSSHKIAHDQGADTNYEHNFSLYLICWSYHVFEFDVLVCKFSF
jgi:hypothetical protein